MFYVTVATPEWNAVVWLTYNQQTRSYLGTTYLSAFHNVFRVYDIKPPAWNCQQTTFDEFSNTSVRTQKITMEEH